GGGVEQDEHDLIGAGGGEQFPDVGGTLHFGGFQFRFEFFGFGVQLLHTGGVGGREGEGFERFGTFLDGQLFEEDVEEGEGSAGGAGGDDGLHQFFETVDAGDVEAGSGEALRDGGKEAVAVEFLEHGGQALIE